MKKNVDPVSQIREVSQRAWSPRAMDVIMDDCWQIAHTEYPNFPLHRVKREKCYFAINFNLKNIFFSVSLEKLFLELLFNVLGCGCGVFCCIVFLDL